MRRQIYLFLIFSAVLAYAKNRDPKTYPECAKVVSFQRQPCLRQFGAVTRICHIVAFELEGRRVTGSCFRCDPLTPGETYPARFDQKEMVIYVIHQKNNGNWGQDDYAVTEITRPEQK